MDGHGEPKVFEYPNMIVRVHSPNISDEENQKRMKRLHIAAAELLMELQKKEKKKDVSHG